MPLAEVGGKLPVLSEKAVALDIDGGTNAIPVARIEPRAVEQQTRFTHQASRQHIRVVEQQRLITKIGDHATAERRYAFQLRILAAPAGNIKAQESVVVIREPVIQSYGTLVHRLTEREDTP